ncbi:hypothetical protein [Streptomyces sp. NPDC057694]|uniref:hypothetical protein n=1 Tax=Streptomyces sp. NPDC057694 TaxID=3346216 RepID=UPI003696EC81
MDIKNLRYPHAQRSFALLTALPGGVRYERSGSFWVEGDQGLGCSGDARAVKPSHGARRRGRVRRRRPRQLEPHGVKQLVEQPRKNFEEEEVRTFGPTSACASVRAEQVLQDGPGELFRCPPQLRTEVLHLTEEPPQFAEYLLQRDPVDIQLRKIRVGFVFLVRRA